MLNNYDATLAAIAAYVIANAPPGADRDILRLQNVLGEGGAPDYLNLEFRPSQDVGCQLYVRIESPEGKYDRVRIMDEAGNRWYSYVVKCEVSWSSWGSSDVATSQRRLACMTEVTRFACELERVFSATFHRLDATACEIIAQNAVWAKKNAEMAIHEAILANSKGMKVGQTKSVVVDAKHDLTNVGEVQVVRKEAGRTFKYSATVERGALDGFQNLVYFMRLEA